MNHVLSKGITRLILVLYLLFCCFYHKIHGMYSLFLTWSLDMFVFLVKKTFAGYSGKQSEIHNNLIKNVAGLLDRKRSKFFFNLLPDRIIGLNIIIPCKSEVKMLTNYCWKDLHFTEQMYRAAMISNGVLAQHSDGEESRCSLFSRFIFGCDNSGKELRAPTSKDEQDF